MDHAADVLHVDAARGHVGRDEHAERPALERAERAIARGLLHLARERRGREPRARERLGEIRDVGARAREDEHLVVGLGEERVHDRAEFVARIDEVDHVIDVGVGLAEPRALDVRRIGLHAIGERAHLTRERGRDEVRAVPLGRVRQDALELVAEAQIEHAIGLVEHHRADVLRVDRAAIEVIQEPPGRAHDHLGALRERAPLVAQAHAARGRGDARAELRVEPRQLLFDLLRELARGRDHERFGPRDLGERLARLLFARGERAQHEADRDGLARAGLRRDAQIAVRERGIEHPPLHFSERGEPPRFEGPMEGRAEGLRDGRRCEGIVFEHARAL